MQNGNAMEFTLEKICQKQKAKFQEDKTKHQNFKTPPTNEYGLQMGISLFLHTSHILVYFWVVNFVQPQVGALEHDLLVCPLVTHFGFYLSSSELELSSLSLSLSLFVPSFPPFAGMVWFIVFARVFIS